MTVDKESFCEIIATDPAGIAEQQAVIDAFKAADDAMEGIVEACDAMHAALDSVGAAPLDQDRFRRERDECFAKCALEREKKRLKEERSA